jgi:hypothetical protein
VRTQRSGTNSSERVLDRRLPSGVSASGPWLWVPPRTVLAPRRATLPQPFRTTGERDDVASRSSSHLAPPWRGPPRRCGCDALVARERSAPVRSPPVPLPLMRLLPLVFGPRPGAPRPDRGGGAARPTPSVRSPRSPRSPRLLRSAAALSGRPETRRDELPEPRGPCGRGEPDGLLDAMGRFYRHRALDPLVGQGSSRRLPSPACPRPSRRRRCRSHRSVT